MPRLRTLARLTLGALALAEGGLSFQRWQTRRDVYLAAMRRANELGRPLVVVGDPDAGAHTRLMRAYGCGDVCVDLHGCPLCPTVRIADITASPVPGIADDSAVVFASCVLEYVADADAALRELHRMAGGRDNLFIVLVQPWTLTAYLYPGARWAGRDLGDRVELRAVSLADRITAAGALATLTILSV